MKKITIVDLEFNSWNGFVFSCIGIEYNNFEGELLGLHIGDDHFIFSLLFIQVEVKSPFI
jgi:hypothetical protein